MNDEIGKRLKKLRMDYGLTQKQFAARVRGGLDYTYVGKIERGEQLPSLKILLKISDALSVPVSYFFQDKTQSTGNFFSTAKIKNIAEGNRAEDLLKALDLLHDDDIPLIIEIIRALARHRKSEGLKTYGDSRETALMAAENGPSYGDK